MTNRELTIRVRYSRLGNSRTPKNTLVTVQDDDMVYFGISRCNRKADTFYKNIGTYIASERALLAKDLDSLDIVPGTGISLHRSGLRGCVPFYKVKEVVEYFKGVDAYCLNNLAPRNVGV